MTILILMCGFVSVNYRIRFGPPGLFSNIILYVISYRQWCIYNLDKRVYICYS